jgi:hypothetical protein
MRFAFIAACLVCANAFATALAQADNPLANKPESSTGRTRTLETKGQKQPQGAGPGRPTLALAERLLQARRVKLLPACNPRRKAPRGPSLGRKRTNSPQGWAMGGEALARSMRAQPL